MATVVPILASLKVRDREKAAISIEAIARGYLVRNSEVGVRVKAQILRIRARCSASHATTSRHLKSKPGAKTVGGVGKSIPSTTRSAAERDKTAEGLKRVQKQIDMKRLQAKAEQILSYKRGFDALFAYLIFIVFFFMLVETRSQTDDVRHVEHGIRQRIYSIQQHGGPNFRELATAEDVFTYIEEYVTTMVVHPRNDTVIASVRNTSPSPQELAMVDPFVQATAVLLGAPYNLQPSQIQYAMQQAYPMAEQFRVYDSAGYSCIPFLQTLQPDIPWSFVFDLATLINGRLRFIRDGSYFPQDGGYLFGHNRYLGGAVMSQKRTELTDCVTDKYDEFYGRCMWKEETREPYTAQVVPGNETFQYFTQTNGYSQAFDLGNYGLGLRASVCRAQILRESKWIDRRTSSISLETVVYNGVYGWWTHAELDFEVTGGVFKSSLLLTSWRAFSFDGDPRNVFQLVMTAIFWIALVISTMDQVRHYRKQESIKVGWVLLDLLSTLNFVAQEVVNIIVIAKAADHEVVQYHGESVQVPSDIVLASFTEFEKMKNIASLWAVYKILTSISIVTSIFRLFKFLRFHERMSVLTATIEAAATELAHFAIMFSIVVCFYAIAARNILGTQLEEFSTWGLSVETFMMILLGDFDVPSIASVSPVMGRLIFWSFILIVFFLLLNVFLSIVVDAFVEVRQKGTNAQTIWDSIHDYVTPKLQSCSSVLAKWTKRCTCCNRSKKGYVKPAAIVEAPSESVAVVLAATKLKRTPSTVFMPVPELRQQLGDHVVESLLDKYTVTNPTNASMRLMTHRGDDALLSEIRTLRAQIDKVTLAVDKTSRILSAMDVEPSTRDISRDREMKPTPR